MLTDLLKKEIDAKLKMLRFAKTQTKLPKENQLPTCDRLAGKKEESQRPIRKGIISTAHLTVKVIVSIMAIGAFLLVCHAPRESISYQMANKVLAAVIFAIIIDWGCTLVVYTIKGIRKISRILVQNNI